MALNWCQLDFDTILVLTSVMADDDDKYVRITFRMPRDLHAKLTLAADERSHSMNAEIVARLEASFSEISERLNALEKEVFDRTRGNEVLDGRVDVLETLARGGDPYNRSD